MPTTHPITLAEDMLVRLVSTFNETLEAGGSAKAIAQALIDEANEMDERELAAHRHVLPCLLSPGDRVILLLAVAKTCEVSGLIKPGAEVQDMLGRLVTVPTPEFLAETAALVVEAEGS
jgi:hypothetical protein